MTQQFKETSRRKPRPSLVGLSVVVKMTDGVTRKHDEMSDGQERNTEAVGGLVEHDTYRRWFSRPRSSFWVCCDFTGFASNLSVAFPNSRQCFPTDLSCFWIWCRVHKFAVVFVTAVLNFSRVLCSRFCCRGPGELLRYQQDVIHQPSISINVVIFIDFTKRVVETTGFCPWCFFFFSP